jgi:hypothetical protein
MAGDELIRAHLSALSRTLPPDIVDELADGLAETWRRHVAGGLEPADAARVAIAEFGTPDQITDAFVTNSPGRRTARLLLASGPIAAVCWGTALITSRAWTWPVPRIGAVLLAAVLLLAIAALVAAATSRHSHRRTRFAGVGAIAVATLDIAMLAIALVVAPHGWPLFPAVTVSLSRIAITVRALPNSLANR